MKRNYVVFLFILSFILSANPTFATKFYSKNNGNWTDGNSWDNGGLTPSQNDTVIINGHSITVNSKIEIKRIEITNTALTFSGSSLLVDGVDTLTVTEDILMTAENKFKNIDISVLGDATFIVQGNVSMIRASNNNSSSWLSLFLYGNSKTTIQGDLSYDYKNSDNLEFSNEIYTYGNAILDVTGQTNLVIRDGKELLLIAEGNSQIILRDSVSLISYGGESTKISSTSNATISIQQNILVLNSGSNTSKISSGTTGGTINITGDLFLESTIDKNEVVFEIDGSLSNGSVNGNISMSAVADSTVYMSLKNKGQLKLGAEIKRPTGYGALKMENDTKLIFNGSIAQSIPSSHLSAASSNKDSLFFSTLLFENTSGQPITLQDNFIIQDTLFLTSGNILTTPTSLLIIEEDAIISGGNSLAYIEGPVLKKGSINENTFTFPIGDSDSYAPITISNTDLSSSQYTARYYSDPPPLGVGNLSGGLVNLSQGEYWTLEKSTGSQEVDITLHWENNQFSGIADPSTLTVAGYNQSSNLWENFGNGGTTGSTSSGTVTNNLASDPPPLGTNYFTFGTTSALNSLPVELISFQAVQNELSTYLMWETSSEYNTSHFSIERSTKDFSFREIGKIYLDGNSNTNSLYSFKDIQPFDGINYYRLKIIDHDGSFEYSNIEVVHFDRTPTNKIFPNPVENNIHIKNLDSNLEDIVIEIYNQNGQLIHSDEYQLDQGQITLSTDLVRVNEAGTYFLRIIGNDQIQILKFIRVH